MRFEVIPKMQYQNGEKFSKDIWNLKLEKGCVVMQGLLEKLI